MVPTGRNDDLLRVHTRNAGPNFAALRHVKGVYRELAAEVVVKKEPTETLEDVVKAEPAEDEACRSPLPFRPVGRHTF